MIVLLDSGPLGMACHPRPKSGSQEERMQDWLRQMVGTGHRILIPAITDYEVRREFIRAGLAASLSNLNTLRTLGFLTLTDEALLKASELWAAARKAHLPTADRHALDGDAILAAQATTLNPVEWATAETAVVVATTNVGHLARYVDARLWNDLPPA
jgi:hypothetical protein